MLHSGEPKKDEGHILVIVKASFSREFRSRFLFKAASQFNGIQEIVTNEDCLGVHETSKVKSFHGKELLSFQGLGVCLLE